MKKLFATFICFVVCCNFCFAAENSATDMIDGHYWEAMTFDNTKSDFIMGYFLGSRHEIDLIAIFTNYLIRRMDSEIADEVIGYLNHQVQTFMKLKVSEYVDFLNQCYKADKRNLNIPIVNMINFANDSENMTRKEIKARLQQLCEIFADKDKKNSK